MIPTVRETLEKILSKYPDYVSADVSADDATKSDEELAIAVSMLVDRLFDDTTAEIERLEEALSEAQESASDWEQRFESVRDSDYWKRQ